MSDLEPADLIRIYPEIDFIVAEGDVSSRYMVSIHQAFYSFAASRVPEGATVLDAGCGTGFGTELLARRAARTIGIDSKDRLVEYAKANYVRDGLEFRVMDVCELDLPDASVDVVVADELLEHLPDHLPFLREALRVLRPGGTMICATVNRVHSFGTADDPLNRNHFREYDDADFRAEFASRFEDVELLGQGFSEAFDKYMNNSSARGIEWFLMKLNVKHRIPAAWRAKVRGMITGVAAERPPEEFEVTGRDVARSLYIVAVARNPKRSDGA